MVMPRLHSIVLMPRDEYAALRVVMTAERDGVVEVAVVTGAVADWIAAQGAGSLGRSPTGFS